MPLQELPAWGLKGVGTDPKAWRLPLEYLTTARNVEISDGAIRSYNGTRVMSAYPAAGGDTPNALFFERYKAGLYWVVCGYGGTNEGSVWAYDRATDAWGDISNAVAHTGIDGDSVWSQAPLSAGVTIYNASDGYPDYWGPIGLTQRLQDLPYTSGADTWRTRSYKAKWFSSHRGRLIACNVNKAGTEHESMFKWSHNVAGGELPSWDETNLALSAGEIQLNDDGGPILACYNLRDSVIVYKRYATWVIDPTSAILNGVYQIYASRRLDGSIGLLAPHSCIVYKTYHFLATPGDIVGFDGNRFESIADAGKGGAGIRKLLSRTVDPDNAESSYAVMDRFNKHLWFCFPRYGASYPDIAVVYDLEENAWSTRELSPDCRASAGGLISETAPNFEDIDWPFSSWTNPFAGATWGSMVGRIAQVDLSNLHVSRDAGLDRDGNSITWTIERTDMRLAGEKKKITVTDIYINCSPINVDLTVRLGAQERPGGTISWEPAETFNPSTMRRVSPRATGNLHCLQLSGPCEALAEISGISVEFQPAGT